MLEYLYHRYSYSNIRLNEFITNLLNLNIEDIQHAHLVDKYLKELSEKKIIEYFPTPAREKKEENSSVSKIGTFENTYPGTISNYYLDVRLTFDGYHFVSNLLREKRQERNISIQTALTKISTLFVAASIIISTISLFKEYNTDQKNLINVQDQSDDTKTNFANSSKDTSLLKKDTSFLHDTSKKQ